GIGYKTNLDEHAIQVDSTRFAAVTVGIGQAGDLASVTVNFGGLRRHDYGDVGQTAKLALQDFIGAQHIAELDECDIAYQTGQVDGCLDTRVSATDNCDILALEQGTVAVGTICHTTVAVLLFARHIDLAPAGARCQDNGLALHRTAIGQLDLDRRLTGDQGLGALQVHDVDIVVPDVLFKRHGKLRTFGVLDRNEVFDGHGVKHLSAEAFGQDSGANAFARG